MSTFYSSYIKNLGKVSETGFQLFWSGNYERCSRFYDEIAGIIGSIEELGLNDSLIYHHCYLQLGVSMLDRIKIPPSPTRLEIGMLCGYEKSQEGRNGSNSQKNILSQPALLSKAFLAAQIGDENSCVEVIETGTFLGCSSYIFSGSFDFVDTIEADPLLFQSSVSWLTSRVQNVRCHLGDSGDVLENVLAGRSRKQLVFLDAHYSTGITSREYGICPLIRELRILMSSHVEMVIIIDDIRCMGTDGYPSIDEILNQIPATRSVTIQYDQMIIV